MKYDIIYAKDYKNEPIQFVGYYVLNARGLPPPEVFFIESLNTEKEIVICAAIQYKCGELIRGHRHDDCIANANKREVPLEAKGAIMGFITSKNRFVDRIEGMKIQKAAGIPSAWQKDGYRGDLLFSEDLY